MTVDQELKGPRPLQRLVRQLVDLCADFRFQIRDESPSSLRTSSRPQPRCPPQRPRRWPRSNLHGGVNYASDTGAWTSTIGARAPSPTYPSPSIPSELAAVCRTPCRSAARAPHERFVDVTPISLRRLRPLQRLVRRQDIQFPQFLRGSRSNLATTPRFRDLSHDGHPDCPSRARIVRLTGDARRKYAGRRHHLARR